MKREGGSTAEEAEAALTVANAIRHPPRVANGRVTLAVRRDATAVHVEVKDPGAGLPARDPTSEGGGVGLAVVDQLCSAWQVTADPTTTVRCTISLGATG